MGVAVSYFAGFWRSNIKERYNLSLSINSNREAMTENLYTDLLSPTNAADPLTDPKAKNELIKSLYGLQGFAKQHIDSFN